MIDKDEASEILGDVVKFNTDEYGLGDEVYEFIESVKFALWFVTKNYYKFSCNGGVKNLFFEKKETQDKDCK